MIRSLMVAARQVAGELRLSPLSLLASPAPIVSTRRQSENRPRALAKFSRGGTITKFERVRGTCRRVLAVSRGL